MKSLWIALTLTTALLFTGCGDMIKGKEKAEEAIPGFHALFDQEKYEEIHATASSDFTASTTPKKLAEFLGAVHRKLGKVRSTKQQNWKINNWNGRTFVVMVQETTFEKGIGTETFTYLMDEGKAVLQGYDIRSNDLIVN